MILMQYHLYRFVVLCGCMVHYATKIIIVYPFLFIDRKKVVEVSFLPADVVEIESHSLPKHRCDISFYIRKFRQIKVSEHKLLNFNT